MSQNTLLLVKLIFSLKKCQLCSILVVLQLKNMKFIIFIAKKCLPFQTEGTFDIVKISLVTPK